MRIVCAIDSLGSGGAQRQMVGVACGLRKRGHEVCVFTYYDNAFFLKDLEEVGVRIELRRKRHRFSPAPVMALRKLVLRANATGVLAYLATPSVYSELACLGMPAVRLIVSERTLNHTRGVSMSRRIRSRLHLLATNVVANSNAQCHWLQNQFPYLRGRMIRIWNGVNVDRFCPGPRRRMGGHIKVLGVGRITPAKNLVFLVEALAECRKRKLDISVDWVGRVDDADYFTKVSSAVEKHGCARHLQWLGERKDIPDLLQRYDAMVLPSLWEGLPNVVCEALASGLPVLASHVSDNRMLIQHGATGLIFDPERVESLVEAFQTFVGLKEDEIQRWRANARRFAEDRLSMDRCVTEYEELLQGTLLEQPGLCGSQNVGRPAGG